MTPLLLALALQATAAPSPSKPPAAPPVPQRFSILTAPCASGSQDGDDIIVCGQPEALAPRLPLPKFRGPPDHAMPSNPDLIPRVALDGPGIGNECGAYGENCPVGGGGYAIPAAVNAIADAVGDALKRKPDKRGRVAIPLDDPKPGANALQP